MSAVLSVMVLSPYITDRSLDYSLLYVGGVMVTVSLRELLYHCVSCCIIA